MRLTCISALIAGLSAITTLYFVNGPLYATDSSPLWHQLISGALVAGGMGLTVQNSVRATCQGRFVVVDTPLWRKLFGGAPKDTRAQAIHATHYL